MKLTNWPHYEDFRNAFLSNARLVDRQALLYLEGDVSQDQFEKALLAYQNNDGGFGNGIEPDLSCPASSAIGAETALYYLGLMANPNLKILENILEWVEATIDETAHLPHPPLDLDRYPHQPWWSNPDRLRVYSVIALLKRLGVENEFLTKKVAEALKVENKPSLLNFYDYPIYLFIRYCLGVDQTLYRQQDQLKDFFDREQSHFPLFTRYWSLLRNEVEPHLLTREKDRLIDAINDNGLLPSPYPQLPWWAFIFTFDALISLSNLN